MLNRLLIIVFILMLVPVSVVSGQEGADFYTLGETVWAIVSLLFFVTAPLFFLALIAKLISDGAFFFFFWW